MKLCETRMTSWWRSPGEADVSGPRDLPGTYHAAVWGIMFVVLVLLMGMRPWSPGWSYWEGYAPSVELRKPLYAERVRLDELFRTRANTWSNLGYVLVGLYALAFGWRDRGQPRAGDDNYVVRTPAMSCLFGLTCCYLGFGSGLFHASLIRWGQQLDVASMYAPILALIAIGAGRWLPQGHCRGRTRAFPLWPVWSGAVLVAGFLLYQYKWSMRADVVLPSLILGLLAFLACDRFQSRWRFNVGWLVAGTGVLIVAVTCRQLDSAGRFSGPDSWFQGHALWHLLTALSLACIYLYHRSESSKTAEAVGFGAKPR